MTTGPCPADSRPVLAGAVHATRGPCAWAAAALWDPAARKLLGHTIARENLPVPYRPGRLAYAVAPAITAALLRLLDHAFPDALLVHGHGLAHPRRFGLACYLGQLHRLRTVGVAEKLLVGEHAPVPAQRGLWAPVLHEGEVVGAALRTRAEAKVLYVSPGWGCTVEEAVALALTAAGRYRWPEPLRHARMKLRHALRRRLELHTPRRQAKMGPADGLPGPLGP